MRRFHSFLEVHPSNRQQSQLRLSRGAPLLWVAGWVLLMMPAAEPALAHSAERGLVLLLPTRLYVVGGAASVLASFLLLAVMPVDAFKRLANRKIRLFSCRESAGTFSSLVSFAILCSLLHLGFNGATDPLANPLPLVFWTGFWVMFTVIQCLTGDLWRFLNPWQGPARLIRRLCRLPDSPVELPEGLGYLPAIILFSAFAWFELIDIAPEDPGRLAIFVLAFWLINFVAVLVFGEQEWFKRGEPFSIFFRLIGAIAPFCRGREGEDERAIYLCLPGRTLTGLPALPVSGMIFVLTTLGTVSYDGLSRTYFWLKAIGVNPLEYPGRSGVWMQNTTGMLVALTCLVLLFVACVFLGSRRLRPDSFRQLAGRLVYSIIPISLVFHCAHYLTQILVNSQYLVLALNDPMASGLGLLGLDHVHVTTSFLSHLDSVSIIWGVQTTVIVIGHVVGIAIAHSIALSEFPGRRAATRSQYFLAGLMVAYTVFGLWLLSTIAIG